MPATHSVSQAGPAAAASPPAGAFLLAGARSPAGHQQQPQTQLPQLSPHRAAEHAAPVEAAALQHALLQHGDAMPGRAAVAAAAAADGAAVFDRGPAAGQFRPGLQGGINSSSSSSRPPSGKLPALQHPQLHLQAQQQLQHQPAGPPQHTAAAAIGARSRAGGMPVTGPKQQQQQQQPPQHQQQQRQHHQPGRDSHGDPEVQQRTAVWAKLMQDMQQGSGGEQFVYLRYAWQHQVPFNPFDLEVRG